MTTIYSGTTEVCPVTGMPTTLLLGALKVLVDDAIPENGYVTLDPHTVVVARNVYNALLRGLEAEKARE